MSDRATILLVDDRKENLLALEAILAPLGHLLIRATSGVAALRELLLHDFACILLDVDMPEIDGFETAQLIKQRGRSQHVPIVFVTALPQDDRQVFHGYSVGAVDYIFKPIDPDILRSKVGVFVDLWDKSRRLHEQELIALERASETRYGQLADAMPQIVWRADVDGNATYFNQRWFDFTGMTPAEATSSPWTAVVHANDREELTSKLGAGEAFEQELRFRSEDGSFRWHLVRTAAIRDEVGRVESWVGTATDIDDRKRAEEQWSFLLEASDALALSLDYRETLAQVARLAVDRVSDWCTVHVVEPDGSIAEVTVAHRDPAQVAFARELQERYPPDPNAPTGAAAVIRTGEPELVPEITEQMIEAAVEDGLQRDLLRQLDLHSYMCVPLVGRDHTLGAITFVSSEPGRAYGVADLRLADELARRAAAAIENARLYREAEQRAEAARAIATIGDGVLLVDRDGRVRLWNAAAARITGLREEELLGKLITSALPGWKEVGKRVPVAGTGEAPVVESVPIDLGGREVWLSLSAVGFEDGIVYAFRDLTEERRLETMRQDLVATVSHELRTPLAAIYGSALTLRREDVELEDEMRNTLLRVIAEEAARLGEIVNDLLLAGQLDSGSLHVQIEPCDPLAIVRSELEAAQAHAPATVELELEAPDALPAVSADPSQLRQVVANLIDNAIKYSPAGGPVTVSLKTDNGNVRLAVSDTGIGIPPDERRRIFEKFYRLDPEMTGGIGGTGLGLYICRELVRRIDGRIWVEGNGGHGSTFVVEIPRVAAPVLAESLG
ncbi:MAG TPA: ATP-binding protein [Gaiellaceae bacterium]